ncbi:MAG: hypothetical protein KAR42_13740 [candidate division Zixibacteria bacterium]|nr:hypothetical protein [candidate division Zixibacteria bacterium]
MGFLDSIFGKKSAKENQFGIEELANDDAIPEDFDVITVDPDEPIVKPQKRPPVIFENGIG